MSDVTSDSQAAKGADKTAGKTFDPEAFALNFARAMESSGQALAAYLKPRDNGEIKDKPPAEVGEVIKTFTTVADYWLSDKDRAADLQMKLGKSYLDLWGSSARRLAGEQAAPVIEPPPRDKRFSDPEWKSNQFFEFVMQAYLLTTQWAQDLVRNAEGLDPHTRKKAEFYVQQITNALAPSNFVLTNPELLRTTVQSSGDNLVRGMKMLAEDIEAGKGQLRIRQSDPANLEVGVNMATTPGKVIYQNEVMQLIQYQPATENVLRTPLLIVPPWINKFYILDLRPEKSFIKWCVDQGLTVFVISWVNPDKSLGGKTFDDYMKEGPLAAMDVIERATGELKVHTMGYCVGGTLLAATLAWLAEKRRVRVTSATFLAAQVDFTHAGDLMVFVDEEQIAALEREMEASRRARGQQDGDGLQHAALQRPDLVLRGQQLPQGQATIGVRPVALEFRRDADAGGQPFVLPAQLLSGKQAVQRHHGARQHAARPVQDQGADLQPRHPRGPHRASGLGAVRVAVFWRPGEVRAIGIRPYCRRGQPAGLGQVSVLDQRHHPRHQACRLAQGRAGAFGLMVAGLAQLARRHRCRGSARATGRQRGLAGDRGRARQLCPGACVDRRFMPLRSNSRRHCVRETVTSENLGNRIGVVAPTDYDLAKPQGSFR